MDTDLSGGSKTLYVGNLDPLINEELLYALFVPIGAVKGCKIIREPGGGDPYAFIEFFTHQAASAALTAMNHRSCFDRELKVNWASSSNPTGGQKVDTSNHFHIFVGDLGPEIDNETLRSAFAPFGDISDCKVVRDIATSKSKGYGFVSFVRKIDAEMAIESMNGQWIGSRAIRTNWASRKPGVMNATGKDEGFVSKPKPFQGKGLTYDETFRQSSSGNCTVYVCGVGECDEGGLRNTFEAYGKIEEIRFFRDKGYAFLRYDNKESACSAIVAVHGSKIQGHQVKCSWGKENPGGGAFQTVPSPSGFQGANDYYPGGAPPSIPTDQMSPEQLQYYQSYYHQYMYQQQHYMQQQQYYAAVARYPPNGQQAMPPPSQ